ncbi:MAG TPA: hypothetical protein VG222_04510 [Vicinamibacterales bacterium]|jgi:hypothetical protein|nr:hypothetical protein [Vicinamibacterales bacterium]
MTAIWSAARPLVSLLCLFLLVPAVASAVTIDQIIAMSKAGVPDAAIVALIERDKTVFALDAAQLVELQQAGVAEAVTVAMIRTDGQPNVAVPVGPPLEQPVVVTYALPYAVPVPVRRSRAVVAVPPSVPVAQVPVAQAATSARGIFFAQPSTGIFFPPPPANCQTPAASPHPR